MQTNCPSHFSSLFIGGGTNSSAGIGAGKSFSCGNIVIESGTIEAIGGYGSAGIGGSEYGNCGTITIKDTVKKVTATKGTGAKHSIGAGQNGTCGTVTIGENVGPSEENPCIYEGTVELPGSTVDLSKITADYIAQDGEILTGTLGTRVKISIADGATVTLRNVIINGEDNRDYKWAGITCEGNATLFIEGSNSVRDFYMDYPGVYVPENKTLTIKGTGSLTAKGSNIGAGIGGGRQLNCGNIVCDGGTITAIGGIFAAGIGGGRWGRCGNITIKNTVTQIKAIRGNRAPNSIGAGDDGTCGLVTIGVKVTGNIIERIYIYPEDPSFDPSVVDLSTVTGEYTAQDGETLTGTPSAKVILSILDGATVTIKDVTNDDAINCIGDAVIILEGINYLKGSSGRSGICVPLGHTLTIKGNGALTAKGDGAGAGIGGDVECGNIIIESGTITAIGGAKAAAGIGVCNSSYSRGGNITIKDTVRKVTAIKGDGGTHSIGVSDYDTCGTITIGSMVGTSKISPYTYNGKGSNGFGTIKLHIEGPKDWTPSSMSCFYGKTIAGIWERLVYDIDRYETYDLTISKEYVAFGFEVDVYKGTDWPYSNVLWTADGSSRPDKIDIILSGTNSSPNVEIKVDDKRVFYEKNCSSKSRYDWQGTGRVIHVKTFKTANYLTNEDYQRLYARKSGGSWTCVFYGGSAGDFEYYIDDDYVEFGFEFDILWGKTWPYSNVFWTISDSEKTKVKDIYIEMTGTTLQPNLDIEVNGRNILSKKHMSSGSRYSW